MRHVKPRKGMIVELVDVSPIEKQNNGKLPIKLGQIGKVSKDPDEYGIFEVDFLVKLKPTYISAVWPQRTIKVVCISKMIQLVIEDKLKVTKVTTALVTKDLKKD